MPSFFRQFLLAFSLSRYQAVQSLGSTAEYLIRNIENHNPRLLADSVPSPQSPNVRNIA